MVAGVLIPNYLKKNVGNETIMPPDHKQEHANMYCCYGCCWKK